MKKIKVMPVVLLALCLSVLLIFTACDSPESADNGDAQVLTLIGVEIKAQPDKTEYFVGEELCLDGASLTVRYSDGSTAEKAVTADMVTGYDKTSVGTQTLTVAYAEDGNERRTTLTVFVREQQVQQVTLSGIEMKKQPDKTVYTVGEELCLDGASLTVRYSDGSTAEKAVTADMVTGYDKTSAGTQTLTVTYAEGGNEKTTTLTVVVNEDEEQPDYLFTAGDEYCWNITEDENGKVSFESLSSSQYLMFNKLRFTGGSISFDLKVTSNEYTYNCASGIVFGADVVNAEHDTGSFYVVGRDPWNELLVFSKDNGAFEWQADGKISGVLSNLDQTYRIKAVWDRENDRVHYFIDGVYQGTGNLNKGFRGEYIGIYADNAGVTVSDIVIDPDETYTPPATETEDYLFTFGDSSNWQITGEGENAVFVSLKSSQFLMFKKRTFTGGSISFKLKFDNKNYTNWTASGILFASDTLQANHDTGSFYVAGSDPWNDFVTFAKDNGAFLWQDEGKAGGVVNETGRVYSLKFIWDSQNDLIHYFVDGIYMSTGTLHKGYTGQYLGIYSENAGLTISDIVIDPEETFVTPSVTGETEDYLFTIGDSSNWQITGEGDSASFRSTKANQLLMFKDKTFTGGSVSFKIRIASDNFTYSIASGIVFASDALDVNYDQGSYYVAGADKWYDFVTFSKDNGIFAWQDTGKIPNAVTEWGKTYDLKFIWDSENDLIHYYIDGVYQGTGTLNGGFRGGYIGIYADNAGVTISDIVIDPEEVYIP